MLKALLKELLWLVASLILTVVVGVFLLKIVYGNSALDVHLHDTYFIINSKIVYWVLFLVLSFLIFFFKEIPRKFSRRIPNIFIIIFGIGILATVIFFLSRIFF